MLTGKNKGFTHMDYPIASIAMDLFSQAEGLQSRKIQEQMDQINIAIDHLDTNHELLSLIASHQASKTRIDTHDPQNGELIEKVRSLYPHALPPPGQQYWEVDQLGPIAQDLKFEETQQNMRIQALMNTIDLPAQTRKQIVQVWNEMIERNGRLIDKILGRVGAR